VAFKGLGRLIIDVGYLVSQHTDQFIKKKVPDYKGNRIQRIVASSRACKARLLHYFPTEQVKGATADMDNWCGWHTDHGSLTGLTSAMYLRWDNGDVVSNPDSECGLYVRDRSQTIHKINIPADEIAFQIGDSSQIHSGGLLKATPHYVKSPNPAVMTGISRNTFAVFMQPEWSEPMNPPSSLGKLPDISSRIDVKAWEAGLDFSSFMKAKLDEYY